MPTALLVMVGLLLATGCNRNTRADDDPGVNVGLEGMMGDEADLAAGETAADIDETPTDHAPATDLESLLAQQAADLAQAMGTPDDLDAPDQSPSEPADEAANVSLEQLLEDEAGSTGEAAASTEAQTPETNSESAPSPLDIDALYAQLDEALGQELGSTSEPFRTAVAMIALAAAQGRDPAELLKADSEVGSTLSPEERESATAIAGLLGSLLAPDETATDTRASLLREFSEKITQGLGLTIPKAILCVRVRGFGKYQPFSTTSFLAGRSIRALVYVEVDGFEHGRVDTSRLGGLPVEEEWSVELSQTLELYHDAEKSILAWKRSAEMIVETSRNKQRDFYLLTEVELPRTLTIGAYQLKVIVRDQVNGRRAEALIPIKIVADPALAWQPE